MKHRLGTIAIFFSVMVFCSSCNTKYLSPDQLSKQMTGTWRIQVSPYSEEYKEIVFFDEDHYYVSSSSDSLHKEYDGYLQPYSIDCKNEKSSDDTYIDASGNIGCLCLENYDKEGNRSFDSYTFFERKESTDFGYWALGGPLNDTAYYFRPVYDKKERKPIGDIKELINADKEKEAVKETETNKTSEQSSDSSKEKVICTMCNGTGKVKYYYGEGDDDYELGPCTSCDEKGYVYIKTSGSSSAGKVTCPSCGKKVNNLVTRKDNAGVSRTWCSSCWSSYDDIMGN